MGAQKNIPAKPGYFKEKSNFIDGYCFAQPILPQLPLNTSESVIHTELPRFYTSVRNRSERRLGKKDGAQGPEHTDSM